MNVKNWCCKNPSLGLLVMRIVVAAIFITHGIMKLGSIEQTAGFFSSIGIPMALTMAWVVALVETIGGIAILLGFWTGIFGTLLTIVMLVAIFTTKIGSPFQKAELDFAMLALSLGIVFSGPGKYALGCGCKNGTCEGSCPCEDGVCDTSCGCDCHEAEIPSEEKTQIENPHM